jgi:hypothetical protein
MRKDEGELGHCVRLWSRMVILCAVIIAVPAILSTIASFVRKPPNLSTLLATPSINTPGYTTSGEPTQRRSTPRQVKLAEVGAPENAALEEPLVVDHPPDTPPSAPSVPQTVDTSSASSSMPVAAEGPHGMKPLLTATDDVAADRADAVAPVQPAPATEGEAAALSSSVPIHGPIQLPRPRPHEAGAVRTADPALSRVPMPRPRPVVAGGQR